MSNKETDFAQLFSRQSQGDDPDVSFAEEMKGIKPIKQDKIHFGNPSGKKNRALASNIIEKDSQKSAKQEKLAASRFHFSDQYEPLIDFEQTLSFVKEGAPRFLSKLLRRGELQPELVLDLHGSNREQAKRDLADLITTCIDEHIVCACVVHGVGSGILKHKMPHYLMQHPNVAAFHQAPLEWGGQGAILFVVDHGEALDYLIKR